MIRWCSILWIVCSMFAVHAQENFTHGIDAYHLEEYEKSVSFFKKSLKNDPYNSSSYYNMGLCFMELKQYGKAIWAFEKVLKYVPNDSETREKIDQSFAKLYPNTMRIPRLNRLESALLGFSSNTWAILAIIFSILLGIAIVAFVKSKQTSGKRLWILLGIVTFIIFIVALTIANKAHQYRSSSSMAIVTKDTIPTFSPNALQLNETIPEGKRVQVDEFMEDSAYCFVQLTSGKRHVVRVKDLTFI